MDAVETVRALETRMEARDWEGVAALVHPAAVIEWPRTGETFTGAAYVAMNRAYPEGWSITVRDLVGSGERAASDLEVTQEGVDGVYVAAGFWTVRDGQVVAGREYWSGPGLDDAPAWRAPYTSQGNQP
ncbi:nuclear transport factor 2 family protein [Mumia zhuanghuii]|uniref:Nuclear transport factor 2 family protein n=1 Tax=Mumia zhuanghuii TaxID=2585211 RepID=A0A5C4MCQ8_9ACTN|nr:nuclear transport factor 2 family protein [Mumia zhuanghuii]TNC34368.1 nuclear transport factor 2 family protein [Mumia zhuanghuii]TNC35971.1 nuclear transport factor 2 family protein [Mumia zhuanghuii]